MLLLGQQPSIKASILHHNRQTASPSVFELYTPGRAAATRQLRARSSLCRNSRFTGKPFAPAKHIPAIRQKSTYQATKKVAHGLSAALGSKVFRRASGGAASSSAAADIVLTREKGKNGKLAAALQQRGLRAIELPLVETAPGPDRHLLVSHLNDKQFDWIVVTSPEAANVFLQAWEQADKPQIRIAVVGDGTGNVLRARQEAGLAIEYTPEVANAVHLSGGLPHIEGGTQKVLYPSSAKAGSDLQTGLQQRGFEVVRLNTYDTKPVMHVDTDKLQQACQASVITFASPSAVKAWQKLTSGQQVRNMAIACIGSTTAIAAEKQGFQNVYYPQQPGIDGFVSAVTDALQFRQTQANNIRV